MYDNGRILTPDDINMSMPIIAMRRYYDIVVLKIEGLEKINEFLELIQIQHKKVSEIRAILPSRCKYDKSFGIELIQIQNVLDQKGEVVALCTVGTIDSAYLNQITKTLYQIEH